MGTWKWKRYAWVHGLLKIYQLGFVDSPSEMLLGITKPRQL